MKMIESSIHTVKYFGMTITKSIHHPFLAVDGGGALWSYEQKPIPKHDFWYNCIGGEVGRIGYVNLDGVDWHRSLIQYNRDGSIKESTKKFSNPVIISNTRYVVDSSMKVYEECMIDDLRSKYAIVTDAMYDEISVGYVDSSMNLVLCGATLYNMYKQL